MLTPFEEMIYSRKIAREVICEKCPDQGSCRYFANRDSIFSTPSRHGGTSFVLSRSAAATRHRGLSGSRRLS